MKAEITFLRHGLTTGNIEKRYIGRTDLPLCKEGRKELEKYVKTGIYPDADVVYSSPLLRCVQTAEMIFPNLEPMILNDLRETDFGDWEGKTYEDLKSFKAYQKWIEKKGASAPPNGESGENVALRLKNAVGIIAADIDNGNIKKASVITHGGCIMKIMLLFADSRKDYYEWQTEAGFGFCAVIDTETLKLSEIRAVSCGRETEL